MAKRHRENPGYSLGASPARGPKIVFRQPSSPLAVSPRHISLLGYAHPTRSITTVDQFASYTWTKNSVFPSALSPEPPTKTRPLSAAIASKYGPSLRRRPDAN
jgi:hypothetical protein